MKRNQSKQTLYHDLDTLAGTWKDDPQFDEALSLHGAKEGNFKIEASKKLLRMAKSELPQIKTLLEEVSSRWGYEDPIYRFYHQSFKIYHVQSSTLKIVEKLRSLAPHLELDDYFEKIILEGTSKDFDMSHNKHWLKHTRPIIEAFFHARHMLEMICKYAEELDEAPQVLPSGWATVLCLYGLR